MGCSYTIKLTTRERVGKTSMNKLHNIAHSQPPDFEIILLEQITLYSMSSSSVQQVKIASDGSMQAQQFSVAAVTTAHGVIDRITALLYSFAYVSADGDWCLLDDARECVQEIWSKMTHSEKHQAPVSFYNDAYVATCQVWQTHIVTCHGTLSSAMQNKASWVPFWDYRCPGCPQCPGWTSGKGGKGTATQSIEPVNRTQRRVLQNLVFQTMEKFTNRLTGSKGKKGGGKQGYKSGGKMDMRKPMYDKPKGDWGTSKGKGTWGKGEGSSGKGKDQSKDYRRWY